VKNAKLKGGLILLGVFVLGSLTGAAGMRAYMQRDEVEELTGGPEARFGLQHFRALARELDLSDEQRQQVREIVKKHRPERRRLMQELSEGCGADMQEHKQKVDAEIRAVLTPEQQQRFDALLSKQRERFPFLAAPPRHGPGGRRGGGGPHGPGRRGGGPPPEPGPAP